MTFPDTTTPHTDTETAPQSCGDDPFGLANIPDFLRRTPDNIKPAPRPRTVWRVTPAMKATAQKDRERREKIAARPVVLQAVEAGADTFGKIRKATGLPNPWIQSALRFHMKERAILKTGKRYRVNARRRNGGQNQ